MYRKGSCSVTFKVPNWSDFQHYKQRTPPWIKLHRQLLDNEEFACLPVASRALAPLVWILASESETGGELPSLAKMAWRLRMSESELTEALEPLVSAGFVEDASGLLARCKQGPMPRQRREEEEKEAEKSGVYAHARVADDPETDPDETDRLDDDIAFEEKRFNTLALAIGKERIQSVLDSIPRPKNVGAFSASRWLATGRNGIGRSEQAMIRLRLTCDGLEHWQREQAQPYMTENTRKSLEAINRVTGAANDTARNPDWARALKGGVPVHEVR